MPAEEYRRLRGGERSLKTLLAVAPLASVAASKDSTAGKPPAGRGRQTIAAVRKTSSEAEYAVSTPSRPGPPIP